MAPKNPKSQSAKSWVFTINNYDDDTIKAIMACPCQKIIVGREVGASGTPHLQGAICLLQTIRLNSLKKLLGGKAHIEPMKGRWADQIYCAKDGDIVRMEDNACQGKRTDLKLFKDDLFKGMCGREVLEKHTQLCAMYPKFEDRVRMMYLKESTRPFRKVEVIVLWGKTGQGKTRRPYDEGAYMVPKTENMKWWNGYDQESCICLNDFYGCCKYSRFLDILDGYQMMLEVKHGVTYSNWTKVYITSNNPPESWYKQGLTPAIARRLTEVIHFDDASLE